MSFNTITRTFSANPGDYSVGQAGPDAIETDIDAIMSEINKIAVGGINTENITDGAITNVKMAVNSVGESNIIDDSISAVKLKSDSVTTDKIVNLSVTDAKLGNRTINDDSVTKLDEDTLTNLLSHLATALKQITGKSDWKTLPIITLENAKTTLDSLQSQITSNNTNLQNQITTNLNLLNSTITTLNTLTNNVLQKDNTTPYTPVGQYNPATKGYVDQVVVNIGAADMTEAEFATNGVYGKVDHAVLADTATYADATATTQYYEGEVAVLNFNNPQLSSDTLINRYNLYEDGEFIYFSNSTVLYKADINTLNIITSVDTGLNISTTSGTNITSDSTHVYVGNGLYVKKYLKSDLSFVSEFLTSTTVYSVKLEGTTLYYSDLSGFVKKISTTDMSLIASSVDLGGYIAEFGIDDTYIYGVDETNSVIKKLLKSDLSVVQTGGTTIANCRNMKLLKDRLFIRINADAKLYIFDKNTLGLISDTLTFTTISYRFSIANDTLFVYDTSLKAYDPITLELLDDTTSAVTGTFQGIFAKNDYVYVATKQYIYKYTYDKNSLTIDTDDKFITADNKILYVKPTTSGTVENVILDGTSYPSNLGTVEAGGLYQLIHDTGAFNVVINNNVIEAINNAIIDTNYIEYTAYENLVAGEPITIINDGGVSKVKKALLDYKNNYFDTLSVLHGIPNIGLGYKLPNMKKALLLGSQGVGNAYLIDTETGATLGAVSQGGTYGIERFKEIFYLGEKAPDRHLFVITGGRNSSSSTNGGMYVCLISVNTNTNTLKWLSSVVPFTFNVRSTALGATSYNKINDDFMVYAPDSNWSVAPFYFRKITYTYSPASDTGTLTLGASSANTVYPTAALDASSHTTILQGVNSFYDENYYFIMPNATGSPYNEYLVKVSSDMLTQTSVGLIASSVSSFFTPTQISQMDFPTTRLNGNVAILAGNKFAIQTPSSPSFILRTYSPGTLHVDKSALFGIDVEGNVFHRGGVLKFSSDLTTITSHVPFRNIGVASLAIPCLLDFDNSYDLYLTNSTASYTTLTMYTPYLNLSGFPITNVNAGETVKCSIIGDKISIFNGLTEMSDYYAYYKDLNFTLGYVGDTTYNKNRVGKAIKSNLLAGGVL